MSWHVNPETLAHYLDGELAEDAASSVEAHLLRCAGCREQLAAAARPVTPSHERTWAALAEAVDTEPASLLERALDTVLPSHVVRLVAAAPALRRAWWTAGTGLLVLALLAAQLGTGAFGTAVFLVSAPLLPLLGVALAYEGSDELAGEVAGTTPYPRFRVLLLRTAAVAVTTLPVAGLLALALPVGVRPASLWLVPALALCALALLLSARFDTRRVAAVLTALWLVSCGAALRPPRAPLPIDDLLERSVVFRPAGQAALLAVAALALVLAVTRRTTFEDRSRA
ncbi:anti-sigma factor family protein [Blastococcus deserti]|uniref:Anti-sigma factor family protein n=1 Tax=Blastococcus deserti TaxID=2259033 RepID=A0ABW4X6L0_9ACTN